MKIRRIVSFAMSLLCAVTLLSGAFVQTGMAAEESYRDIRVYELKGQVQVERPEIGTLDAYLGMMLETEDVLITGEDGFLYFQMDGDKYALLEPNSRVRLVASGSGRKSKTCFYLEEGAIVSRLDVDLGQESVYEVNSPNSTMAVRGTNFRIQVIYDENGVGYTYLDVFEGTVACRLIFPDGTLDEEELTALGGSAVGIRGDEEDSIYLLDGEEIDYPSLKRETLEFLLQVAQTGVPLSISTEDLEALIAQKRETCEASPDGIHQWAHESYVYYPSCTAVGLERLCCANCQQEQTQYIPALGHSAVTDRAVDATCTATGLTEGSHCSVCGEVLVAQQTTQKADHTPATDEAVPASCTATGLTEGSHCSVCGEVLVTQQTTQKADHTPVTDEAVPASCTATGLTEGSHCSVCGGILTAQEEIPALGHLWSSETGKCTRTDCGATCTHASCTILTPGNDPTCKEGGWTDEEQCNDCGMVFAQTPLEALGHDWSRGDGICAECGEECEHIETGDSVFCSICGKNLYGENIPDDSTADGI